MALLRNSFIAGLGAAAACIASPVLADDSTFTDRPVHRSHYLDENYIYDYMNHRDSITIGLGDAPTSNIIIMHPTPWPSYINNTQINITAQQGISALENLLEQAQAGGSASSSSGSTTGGTDPSTGMTTSGAN